MPLQKFFAQRKRDIENFLADAHVTLLRVAADPEAESMVIKLLSAVDASPKNADIFIGCDHTFGDGRSFYPRTLERLAEEHDLLVIDTPPAGMVTDALTVAAAATVTVMVVEAGRTNAVHAAATIESLRAVGANVVGVVLNKARDRSLSGYYYRYGYGPEESDAADMDPRRGTGGTAAQWAQSNLRSRRRERPLSRADQLPRRTMAAPGSDGGVLDGRPPPSTGR